MEYRGQHALALGVGQELGAVAEQTTRRDQEFQTHAIRALGVHGHQFALAAAHLLHDRADRILRHVRDHALDRLAGLTVDFTEQRLRRADLELIALTAQVFNQDGQMHLAAAADAERVGRVGFVDTQGNVLEQLAEQALAQVARGDKLAFLARKRRIVDREGHFDRRLGNFNERQCFDMLRVAQGFTDGDVLNAGEADDLARLGFVCGFTLQLFNGVERNDLGVIRLGRTVIVADRDLLANLHRAALDAADADAANILVVVDRGNQHLGRAFGVDLRRRDVLQNLLKQRGQVGALGVRGHGCGARAARAIHDRAVQLLVRCVEVQKKLKHLIADLAQTGIRTVDLVDRNDDLMAKLQRFLEDETGLGHRAFRCVDQQHNAVHHLEDTLDLAGKVRVARGIDDVDFDALVMYRSVFCQNGDAAFTLDVARVHDALFHHLIFTECACLLEHLVDQRGLAVVNVCDDGNVAQIVTNHIYSSICG